MAREHESKSDLEIVGIIKRTIDVNKIVDYFEEIQIRTKSNVRFMRFINAHDLYYLNPVYCFFSEKWIPLSLSSTIHICKKTWIPSKHYYLLGLSKDEILKKVVIRDGYYVDRNQDFVDPSTFEVKHGFDFNLFLQELIPLWEFKKSYSQASCGHFSRTTQIIDDFCEACIDKLSVTGKLINPYSLKVPSYLKFLDKKENKGKFTGNTLYFGFELELENGREKEAIKLYKKHNDFIICKEDGTVNDGFEIVSTPATYPIHKERAESIFTIINKETKMVAKRNCGLHFHISKNALTSLQIGKMLEFIFNPNNREFISHIAGRDNNSYAQIDKVKSITDIAPENFNAELCNRQEAINLKNKDTIEFRLFASTTKYDIFMTRLEFVKSLVDYTKSCAINIKNLIEAKEKDIFIGFLKENKKEYPFLAEFLKLRIPYKQKEIV